MPGVRSSWGRSGRGFADREVRDENSADSWERRGGPRCAWGYGCPSPAEAWPVELLQVWREAQGSLYPDPGEQVVRFPQVHVPLSFIGPGSVMLCFLLGAQGHRFLPKGFLQGLRALYLYEFLCLLPAKLASGSVNFYSHGGNDLILGDSFSS